mgnify:CR=1 FL=1
MTKLSSLYQPCFSHYNIILKNTKFEEVILCDCDSLFLTNPEVIFDDKHYIETGTYFFKDYLLHIPKDAQEERNRMKEVKETKLVDKKSNQPNDIGGGFQNSGVWQTDGLSGFRG